MQGTPPCRSVPVVVQSNAAEGIPYSVDAGSDLQYRPLCATAKAGLQDRQIDEIDRLVGIEISVVPTGFALLRKGPKDIPSNAGGSGPFNVLFTLRVKKLLTRSVRRTLFRTNWPTTLLPAVALVAVRLVRLE